MILWCDGRVLYIGERAKKLTGLDNVNITVYFMQVVLICLLSLWPHADPLSPLSHSWRWRKFLCKNSSMTKAIGIRLLICLNCSLLKEKQCLIGIKVRHIPLFSSPLLELRLLLLRPMFARIPISSALYGSSEVFPQQAQQWTHRR